METPQSVIDTPSLEGLVETGMLTLESLHPGGIDTTAELAKMCEVGEGDQVLDVASGTGESACFLAETFGAQLTGVDRSEAMIHRATAKARGRDAAAHFTNADAASLPFGDNTFDVAICECTLCLLDKARVLGEMTRVVRSGGRVGMHDLYWQEGAPADLKRTLHEIEGEDPESLGGWRAMFERAGLVQVTTVDRSNVKSQWMRESRQRLGVMAQLELLAKVVKRWGLAGAWQVLRSERVLSSDSLGYVLVVGTKP